MRRQGSRAPPLLAVHPPGRPVVGAFTRDDTPSAGITAAVQKPVRPVGLSPITYETVQVALPCVKVLGPPGAFLLITYAHSALVPLWAAVNP